MDLAYNQPTGADYTDHQVRENRDKLSQLERRVDLLEELLAELTDEFKIIQAAMEASDGP